MAASTGQTTHLAHPHIAVVEGLRAIGWVVNDPDYPANQMSSHKWADYSMKRDAGEENLRSI